LKAFIEAAALNYVAVIGVKVKNVLHFKAIYLVSVTSGVAEYKSVTL
jgi:hypothetical protein